MNSKKNALFTCDALTFLERLPSEVVTLTYLDPPWNTGSDFMYPMTRELSNEQFASYISKVVQQVCRVLIDEGSLFIHWSHNSPLDVRLVVNQVFGKPPNYEITWHKKNRGPSVNIGLKIDNEFILVYSKSDKPICNKLYRPLSPEEASLFNKKDERGLYRTTILTSSFDRPSLQFPWRGYQLPQNRSWCFTLDKLEILAQENRIHFSSQGLPQLKKYLDDHPGGEIGMTWDDIPHECTKYIGQLPLALMERIIQLASNPGDQLLDPFCGSGTTLVAAQSLKRHWWGIDSSFEAQQITMERLLITHSLKATKDYDVLNENDILQLPVKEASYRDVVVRVGEIAKLKQDMDLRLGEIAKLKDETAKLSQSIDVLTDFIFKLKKQMNIGEDDNERVENVIKQMEDWITVSIANQLASIDSYIDVVCSWLTGGWERLDIASQLFLPQAELLFENIEQTNSQDYSPFIIQYCRALENELLTKLFTAYTDNLYSRPQNIDEFLAKDIAENNKKETNTSRFIKSLQGRKCTYTLGDMNFIMQLLEVNGGTLKKSPLLQDFRAFTIRYFTESIVDKRYLDQIKRINEDFRCKAAHPYVLDIEVAKQCRSQVRACLNELILKYSGKSKN